jgi:signal transduction histidine kinase
MHQKIVRSAKVILASCLFILLVQANLVSARAAEVLTNATSILKLPARQAALGLPVAVTGIVTAAETNWNGRFFVQDTSGGVFVESLSKLQPVPGDVVEITGITRAGGYAPCITKPSWKKIGEAALPPARPVTIEQLMSGTEDCQRVEITGVVRAAQMSGSLLGIEFVSGGYRLHAYSPVALGTDLTALVGAKIRLHATAATSFNAPLRHFLTVTLYVPREEDVIVEQTAPAGIFEAPTTPLNAIAQYRPGSSPGSRVHVKGVVTYQRRGEDIFLQDETGGLQVRTKMTNSVNAGEVVEAVGFPSVNNFLPVLEDAVFRRAPEPRREPLFIRTTAAELLAGSNHADCVSISGVLIDRLVKSISTTANTTNFVTTLVLQTTNFFFTAEKTTTDQNYYLVQIPIGSRVEASGICLLESGDDAKIKSARVLLPASYNVQVLKRPSWFTAQRLLATLAIVFTVLLVAVSWSVMVSQKNLTLKSLVREKETAQRGLQEAHDLLEERVKERTAQLKVEMTARKESELQFRAVLTERTRLAQELHDTLEQTMTGIALQLDLVASQFRKSPDDAAHHLKLARRLMHQSQADVRQSVWGLRSRSEEEFNLVNAININSRQIVNGAGMQIEIKTSGTAQPLSEVAEENLLRISQEAMTNVVKHSAARTVKIELIFAPERVVLQVKDDGKGFSPENCAGPKDGHFGLLGIRERTERLGGQVNITSAPDSGTLIRVEIPLDAQNTAVSPA